MLKFQLSNFLKKQGKTIWNEMRKEAHILPMINNIPTLYILHDSTVSCCGVGELKPPIVLCRSLLLGLLGLSLYRISLARLGPICTCLWGGRDKQRRYIDIRRRLM